MNKMMLTPANSMPRIVLEKCTIRGEGDLVTLRASRPLDLQVKDSLVYLQGSLVQQQQGAAKERTADDAVSIRVDHSAILTEAAMLQIHAGKSTMPRFQHPFRVVTTDSLFVRLGDQPIVLLDVPDVMEKMVTQHVDWRGQKVDRGDAFVNFGPNDPVLAVSPAENGIAPQFIERDWQENYYKQTANLRFFAADPIRLVRPLSGQDPGELVSPTDQTEALMPYLDVGKRLEP